MRKIKNIKQNYIAEKSNISVRALQNYESGKRIPNVITAIKISEILGIKELQEFKELFQESAT